MLSAVVFLLFFAMFGAMLLGRKDQAYIWVFLSIIVFPPCIYFTKNPQISPQQLFLYVFFAISLLWNREALSEAIFKHPLRIPLAMLAFSLLAAAVLNGEGAKGAYNAFRYYMENYAYLIIAFVGGLNYKKINLEKNWLFPVVFFCILGVIEFVSRSNIIFPFICKAFPYYDGYFDLVGTVSASRTYRSRIFITTTHPTVLGSIVCSALMFYTCRMKSLSLPRNKKRLVWAALFLLVCLSGSRTAVVCAMMGLGIFAFMKVGIRARIMMLVLVGFLLTAIIPRAIESFSVEGQGSSMSMRQEQLLFSYLQFMKSPIYGNGVRYISKYVMERDTYNDRVADEELGGLESVIFFQLIDYGLIGLVSYFLLFLLSFIYFFRRRRFTHAQAGLLITCCFFVFACLSGEIGGNNSFAYMLMGYCMGACRKEEEAENEDSDEQKLIENENAEEVKAEVGENV